MRKNKRNLLVAIASMGLVAAGTGAVSTFAWYQATSNAAVNVAAASGDLSTTASQVGVANYTVNFTVTPTTATLQLSHVATAEEGTADEVGGAAVADLNAGDLVYGGVHASTVKVIKCASATNFITAYTISASWASTPTDPADITALGGKKFTINLGITGQARLLADNDVTGQENLTSATAVVHIAASTLALSVDTYTAGYVHIEPSSLNGTENGTVGAVTVATASNVTLA